MQLFACRWGILPKNKEPDTAIINVYDVEDCIPPHIDHHDFDRPFCTISLLSQQNIMFGSRIMSRGPGDFVADYQMALPTGHLPAFSLVLQYHPYHHTSIISLTITIIVLLSTVNEHHQHYLCQYHHYQYHHSWPHLWHMYSLQDYTNFS